MFCNMADFSQLNFNSLTPLKTLPLEFITNYAAFMSPMFWVWLTSVAVWLFLEIGVWEAQAFNTKHSFVGGASKDLIFLLHLPTIVCRQNLKFGLVRAARSINVKFL